MRVPSEAAPGKVKVTLSLESWKEHEVEPATFELTLTMQESTAADEVSADD